MIFAAIADWVDSKIYPVDFMCRQLGVSRQGFYKWLAAEPSKRSRDDSALILIMKKVYSESRGILACVACERGWPRSATACPLGRFIV